jgi:DNA-binding GntR family transcriptional regulator
MPVSRQNLEEVTVLRCEMEGFALREAIRQGDDHWEGEIIATLYRLNKIEKMQVGDARIEQWEGAHRALHQKLLAPCGMPLLLHFCTTLHDLSDRYRRLFFVDHAVDRDVQQEHMDICHATVERRADDACRLLRSHIERTGANVMRALIDRQTEASAA